MMMMMNSMRMKAMLQQILPLDAGAAYSSCPEAERRLMPREHEKTLRVFGNSFATIFTF